MPYTSLPVTLRKSQKSQALVSKTIVTSLLDSTGIMAQCSNSRLRDSQAVSFTLTLFRTFKASLSPVCCEFSQGVESVCI